MAEPLHQVEGDRRDGPPRRHEDRFGRFRDLAAMLLAFSGGLAVMFLFFAAIGAVDLTEAVGLAAAVLGLALVWLVGVWIRWRSGDTTSRITRADRERRGF